MTAKEVQARLRSLNGEAKREWGQGVGFIMQIPVEEGKLFYKLYAALLGYVNRKLEVVPEQFSDSEEYTSLLPKIRVLVRDGLYEHRELIERFVRENSAGLSSEELEIVSGWRNAIVGKFYVMRYLKKYAVFLSSGESPKKAYGVLALASPLDEVIGSQLPILTTTVLLPFKDKIIYDGLISAYSVSFGPGIRGELNEEYNEAKETFGIITSLSEEAQSSRMPKKRTKQSGPTTSKVGGRSVSEEAKEIADALVQMTNAFCEEFLNEEYAELCRKLTEALARKRPSPLLQGRLETWACGIVRTIGWINFLDDRSQSPYLKLPFIDKAFGVAESTGQGKSKTIRTMLKIRNFDHRWTLPSRMDENPMVWMLEVNGFLMDVRSAPRELQEAAYEKGLIPYIPADRDETEGEPPSEQNQ